MHQTLFVIPRQIAGIDVFGFGWVLGAWVIVSVGIVGWSMRKHGFGPDTRGLLPMLGVVALAIVFLLPMLQEPDGLPIRGYGVMLLLSVLAGVALSMRRARQVGLDPEIILSLATWFFISGLLGARLFYIIEYWSKFQKPTLLETLISMVNLTQGGLVVYGSLLAGGAALLVFIQRYRLPGLAFADLIAPGVVLGVGLGRMGCFLNGCCYGGISDVPWALRFPEGSPPYVDQVESGKLFIHGLIFAGHGDDLAVIGAVEPGSPATAQGLAAGQRVTRVNGEPVNTVEEAQLELLRRYGAGRPLAIQVAGRGEPYTWSIAGPPPRSRPVHPTQLYSLIDALLLCLLLLAYEPFKKRDGELTALVLTIHPISRFLLEVIRIDESAVFGTGMSISQNISIGIFLAGLAIWGYLLTRPRTCFWPGRLALAD